MLFDITKLWAIHSLNLGKSLHKIRRILFKQVIVHFIVCDKGIQLRIFKSSENLYFIKQEAHAPQRSPAQQ